MQTSSAVCSCSYAVAPTHKSLPATHTPSVFGTSRRVYRRQGRRRAVLRSVAGLSPDQLHDLLPQLLDHVSMAYERVTLPCSAMNCGDMIHKSTLDPVLRMEQKGINPEGVGLVALALAYLTATPGVLAGAIDYYIIAKINNLRSDAVYVKEDFKITKKIATGGFGTVYRAELDDGKTPGGRPVIIKKAKEFGEAEVWMNERLMRAAPGCFAEFITAFEAEEKSSKNKGPEPLWLIWQYEGDYTLWDLMQKKDFPYNLEQALLGRELDMPKGPQRKAVTISLVMQQILEALKASHRTGIVHRDVKPQNVIISETDNKVKFIDMGAAADLRVGINYVPNEYLLDPRYAPPQQYIMSTQTPRAPPLPVAAFLSPILWRLNNPDKFDMYSVGVLFLQMIFPNLRTDNQLQAFNRKLESLKWDMSAWRGFAERKATRDSQEAFQMLNMNDGSAWELLTSLMQYQPNDRLSASAALRHRWFGSSLLAPVGAAFDRVASSVGQSWKGNSWGSQRAEGLTEAQIREELQNSGADEIPMSIRNASNTVNWWRQRQAVIDLKVRNKQAKLGKSLSKNIGKVTSATEQTVRVSRRKGSGLKGTGFKLPSLLTGSRTTG
ncbi:hypothetical protein ABBQ38_009592 [Trebouxia sp. C0009 RCD-2024]